MNLNLKITFKRYLSKSKPLNQSSSNAIQLTNQRKAHGNFPITYQLCLKNKRCENGRASVSNAMQRVVGDNAIAHFEISREKCVSAC